MMEDLISKFTNDVIMSQLFVYSHKKNIQSEFRVPQKYFYLLLTFGGTIRACANQSNVC